MKPPQGTTGEAFGQVPPAKPGLAFAAEPAADHDQARAQTDLPLSPQELRVFLANSERLFRLNPHLAIERWEGLADGFSLQATNELNGLRHETQIQRSEGPQGPVFTYASGLKQVSAFTVEPLPAGARLTLIEWYPRLADPADPRVAEVDPSLVPWVWALRRHLLGRRRWGWLPGWRWWQEGFLPSLPPNQRRIARLLLWVSAGEFGLFLVLVLVLALAP